MSNINLFNNEELGIQVRTILNQDGSISINAEDTATGFGWTQIQNKGGKEYVSVRWERMNAFSKECGFPHEWGKDDYVPESLFYMLGMKAGNERALKYQKWLAMEVLPSIRKTGSYEISKPLTAVEQLKLNQQAIIEVSDKLDSVDRDLQTFKQDMPILGIEESRITNAVKHKGVECLGGKKSSAYQNKSLRSKVYSDIYGQLKREFGVSSYKAIKRSQADMAIGVVDDYKLPYDLQQQIDNENAQLSFGKEEIE